MKDSSLERKMLLLLIGPALAYAVFLGLSAPEARWRAYYFAAPGFAGEPIVKEQRDLAFRMGYRPPIPELAGAASFSARFETCLVLDREQRLGLQLVAEEGGRLFVDGKLVLDNWRGGEARTVGTTVTLGAGVHPLRVEYFKQGRTALLALNATFEGELPGAILPRDLRLPDTGGGCR